MDRGACARPSPRSVRHGAIMRRSRSRREKRSRSPGPVQRAAQHGVTDQRPQPGRAGVQGQPRRSPAGPERGVQRGRHGGRIAPASAASFRRRTGSSHTGSTGSNCRSAGPPVSANRSSNTWGRVSSDGPVSKREAVAAVLPQLPPVGVRAVVQLHPVPQRGQPGGRRQPADPGPDDHHTTHRSPSLRSVGASRGRCDIDSLARSLTALPRCARSPQQPSLPGEGAAPMPDPGADQQAEQRDHGRRMGQRVRPGPAAAAARGDQPARRAGQVADEARAREPSSAATGGTT